MKRKTINRLLAGVILTVIFFLGAVFWALGTSAGARWVLGELSSHTSFSFHAENIEGRIWGNLSLKKLQVKWPQGSCSARSLHILWNPAKLFYGNASVDRLIIEDVYIRDDRPEMTAVPEITWPHVTGLLSRISANIGVFNIKGLTYRRLNRKPAKLNVISRRIRWGNGILTVRDLRVGSPPAAAEGTLMAGFVMPSLSLDLAVAPARPAAGIDMISVAVRLQASRTSGPLKGEIRLTGSSRNTPRIKFASGLELQRHAVRLAGFRVTRITRKGSVTGSGRITFSEGGPRFQLAIKTADADFSPLLPGKTDLSGTVVLDGTVEDYHGRLDLSNKGDNLKSVHLDGSFHGNGKAMELTFLKGSWLGGTVRGLASAGWKENISLQASLQIRSINPSLISPEWTGQVNADVNGEARLAKDEPIAAAFGIKLLKSSLRGRVLKGNVRAGILGSNLRIDRLSLQGKGFDITAGGELLKRITFSADIEDLSGLVPGARGVLHTAGWIGRHEGLLGGNIEGQARRVGAENLSVEAADFSARLSESRGYPLKVRTNIRGLLFHGIRIESAGLNVAGTLSDHVIKLDVRSPGATVAARFSGGYKKGKWAGRISNLSEKDSTGTLNLYEPSAVVISREKFSLSRLLLKGAGDEQLEVGGNLALAPVDGFLHVDWRDINLGRANYWLPGIEVAGRSSGRLDAQWLRNVLSRLSGKAEGSGTLVLEGQKMTVGHASVQLDRDEHRLLASFDVGMDKTATLKGHLSSLVKKGVFPPDEGTIDAQLRGLDLSLFRRWMPEGIAITGTVSGNMKGELLPDMRLDVAGNVSLSSGVISRRSGKGEVSASVQTADVKFAWHDQSLAGTVSLVLQDYGHAGGSFEIPLKAGIPPVVEGNGTVNVSIDGRFQENGLLAAFFPGLVQETHGRIDIGIKVGGVWNTPDLKGTVDLSDAGAYFPAGGIHIKDTSISARLEGHKLIIDSFNMSSGSGKIEGTAEITLRDWKVAGYKGTLKGKDFEVIYLPELRIHASPDLTFEGSAGKLSVKGEIRIPYLLVLQSKTKTPVEPSEDVVIIDRKEKQEKEVKTAIDIQVTMILGDRVFVKGEGIDARLAGSVNIKAEGIHDITGKGQIHVVKGKYSAYGVSLDIVRGQVIFAGQSVSQPNLDVLALRTSGDVKAGVTVTGTPQNPVVKLYSDPAMSDTDILSYIVLGHPLGGGQQQADLVSRAAGFLLSASDSVVFQDQLKHRLGIDTLDIETQPTTAVTTGPPGSAPESVSRSLVTVGKYLTPSLYISYGRSLLGNSNLFRLRYTLSRHWELQTESGSESGGDLFYKINLK